MNILGIWDGHDAGAALLVDGRLVAAINEERLTRRKLETSFPFQSIAAVLTIGGLGPDSIDVAACSTADVAKTIGRMLPFTKESYYQVRRRKAPAGIMSELRRRAKYRITEWPPNPLSRSVSRRLLRGSLERAGLRRARLEVHDHHESHAATAGFASGFDRALVITLDGVGDGLSSTVSTLDGGRLSRLASTAARDSLGVFFEHVTSLLNMRELEDEGKVMALADYSPVVPLEENTLHSLVTADGLSFRLAMPGHRLRRPLARHLWHVPNEQFARMAQQVVESVSTELAREAVRRTGLRRVALAGGVASNIKATRRIRLLPEVDDVFVFPHMGDGGLALGAAMLSAVKAGIQPQLGLTDLGLGPSYDDRAILDACRNMGLAPTRPSCLVNRVSSLLAEEKVVLWFQGRMEYGPRALGHRSILARPDRPALRDRLNLVLKRRVWYQPFCPSIREHDAERVLSDWKGSPNRHMAMAYDVNPRCRHLLAAVINVDGSCRPQIVPDSADDDFARLLTAMKPHVGIAALLNSSFNIHGEPLVCSPQQALDVYARSGADALAIGPFLLERTSNA